MNFVIVTSAYSRGAGNDAVIRTYMSRAEAMFVPTIVLGELNFGYRKGNRTEQNMESLQRFLSDERVQVVPIDEKVAEQYGRMRFIQESAGKTIAPNDLWIAAVCLHLQLPLLTTDDGLESISQLQFVLPPQK